MDSLKLEAKHCTQPFLRGVRTMLMGLRHIRVCAAISFTGTGKDVLLKPVRTLKVYHPVRQPLVRLRGPIMADRIGVGSANSEGVFAPTYPAFPPGPWYPASVLCYLATTLSDIRADDPAARDLALALAKWASDRFQPDSGTTATV